MLPRASSVSTLTMSSSDTRSICRYYGKPGGCYRTDCRFRHVAGATSGSDGTAHASPRATGHRGFQRGGAPRSAGPRAPHGFCDFYYNRGFCARGSECHFRHESPRASTRSPSPSSPMENLASFLTPTALARIQGAGTDGFFAASPGLMKPSEVNYHVRKFLDTDYRFRFAADVYGFVALMSNASSGNASWVRR